MRKVVLVLALCLSRFCFALTSFDVKYDYAKRFHQAFVTQSLGESTKAFYMFQNAFMDAQRAGEHPAKLQAILEHFIWYRFYGQGTDLFAIQPKGSDRITGAYPLSARIEVDSDDSRLFCEGTNAVAIHCGLYPSNRQSVLAEIPEYGRYSPREIAELQTEFMVAEGMVIAGLLLSCFGQPQYGVPICIQGSYSGLKRQDQK